MVSVVGLVSFLSSPLLSFALDRDCHCRSLHVFLRVCHNSFPSATAYIGGGILTADWRSESAHANSNVIMFTFTERRKDSKAEEHRKTATATARTAAADLHKVLVNNRI